MSLQKKVLKQIKTQNTEYGYSIISTEDATTNIPYAYTIGLYTPQFNNHHELFISGLDSSTSHTILNSIIEEHIKTDEHKTTPLIVETELKGVLQNDLKVKVKETRLGTYSQYCGVGARYLSQMCNKDREKIPLFQIVWPTRDTNIFITKSSDVQLILL